MSDPAPLPMATPPGWHLERATRSYRWWDGIQWAFYAPEEQAPPASIALASMPAPTNPYAAVPYPWSFQRPTNGMATASLVLGIVGLVTCSLTVPAVLAVIFGTIGIRRARQRGGVGRTQSIWGMVLGGIVVTIMTIVLVVNLTS